VVLGLSGKTFFWELATLVDVMLLGHWIEMKSVLGASRALEKLMELLPDTAHRLDEQGNEEEVSVSELREGDLLRIKPGEKIPADGDIEGGSSDINESMLTGESKMVEKKAGDEVFAGSVNGGGALQIRVSGAGEATYLSKVVKMVRDAQS
ncbi:MAG: heavy metal translocating P-type ATPase, partial [Saprospiraceae bacterium]|nr:heavy metal translocating P-type ATPase [Saprospiraceae bacterium]MCB0681676.1 heavy metal translocating P-type ATPase [Saprospiraceae bacterium]